jgi:hypothetical protein
VVDEIFFQIPSILQHHEAFLEELQKRLDTWDLRQKIGDLFLDVSVFISLLHTEGKRYEIDCFDTGAMGVVFAAERGRVLHGVHQQLAAGQVGHLERVPLQAGVRALPRGHLARAQG